MTYSSPAPTPSWTVGDVMRYFPLSMMVFDDLGIDTCCDPRATLDVAARNAGISSDALLDALRPSTVEEEPSSLHSLFGRDGIRS